jgi:magnesium chelatase family protein
MVSLRCLPLYPFTFINTLTRESPTFIKMLSKVYSYGLSGLDAYPITIEVDVSTGLPAMNIVGLPDNAIKESKERVRSAIKNSGYKFGPWRITVNLSPADIKKEGPSFDLAIALGILAATEQMSLKYLEHYVVLGELSLDGLVKPTQGVLSIAVSLGKDPFKGMIVGLSNAKEAAIARNLPVYPVKTLKEAVHILSHPDTLQPFEYHQPDRIDLKNETDFSDIKGQTHVKRGLEIAAAGSHNLLMIGPPGSGKSMLAKRFTTILPDMTWGERIETSRIHSIVGLLGEDQGLIDRRPFRSPHHTTSDIAIVGGGSHPKPGEITLSHNGVLFLDEFPEFNRSVIEALRQPLEDHCVTIARATRTIKYPARFLLICAMNPCLCGYFMDTHQKCRCSHQEIFRYMSKISGPLLDRIDLHLEVPRLQSAELLQNSASENSQTIKTRTTEARHVQLKRFENTTVSANAYMNHKQIKQFCSLDSETKLFFKKVIEELGLSARAYDKVLKVARTIADLSGEETITIAHLAEAIQFRYLDRGWWQ